MNLGKLSLMTIDHGVLCILTTVHLSTIHQAHILMIGIIMWGIICDRLTDHVEFVQVGNFL